MKEREKRKEGTTKEEDRKRKEGRQNGREKKEGRKGEEPFSASRSLALVLPKFGSAGPREPIFCSSVLSGMGDDTNMSADLASLVQNLWDHSLEEERTKEVLTQVFDNLGGKAYLASKARESITGRDGSTATNSAVDSKEAVHATNVVDSAETGEDHQPVKLYGVHLEDGAEQQPAAVEEASSLDDEEGGEEESDDEDEDTAATDAVDGIGDGDAIGGEGSVDDEVVNGEDGQDESDGDEEDDDDEDDEDEDDDEEVRQR